MTRRILNFYGLATTCTIAFLTGHSMGDDSKQKGSPKDSPAVAWVKHLASTYDSRDEGKKHLARGGQEAAKALPELALALAGKTNEEVKALEYILFIPRYDAIWKNDRLQPDRLKQCVSRIEHLSKDSIQKWQAGLKAVHKDEVSELWTVGILVNIDRLFAEKAFKPRESELLLEHLKVLPEDAVKSLASMLNVSKARAAASMVEQDWLFEKKEFNRPAFDEALKALKEALPKPK